ncbi:MAG: hypothetical protein K2Q18_09800 [Bdellovibrionales bacterium]|nr:hypothetical protein [Bdellovibrionales bacterium]
MKTTKFLLLVLALCKVLAVPNIAHAQEEEMIFPEESSVSPTSSTPPVIIDDSDSNDVSDVEEYDG